VSEVIKRLVILGSTGSIGRQTLDVVRRFPERFKVAGLAAGNNTELLRSQVAEFHPAYYSSLASLNIPRTKRLSPDEMAVAEGADIIVVAVSGRAGLRPTLAALRAGKPVALANKETLVMAGELVMREAKKEGALRPVDSEHSAVWQCLESDRKAVRRVILTASGGPFYRLSPGQLASVTAEQALKHPTWKMGKKVTIDSATLMNKGLEVIEAHWLFGLEYSSIEVVVHTQSMAHALVEYVDGAVKAQLANPDMRLPIQYALSWPERLANPGVPWLDLCAAGALTFEAPDLGRFPCLRLALEAGRRGGTYPAVLCGADEAAVSLFLEQRIGFGDISAMVERVLERHNNKPNPALDDILAAEAWGRESVTSAIAGAPRCS
jgi:1-deoxy-D-xylulose-5-phosphate reductoisomerase